MRVFSTVGILAFIFAADASRFPLLPRDQSVELNNQECWERNSEDGQSQRFKERWTCHPEQVYFSTTSIKPNCTGFREAYRTLSFRQEVRSSLKCPAGSSSCDVSKEHSVSVSESTTQGTDVTGGIFKGAIFTLGKTWSNERGKTTSNSDTITMGSPVDNPINKRVCAYRTFIPIVVKVYGDVVETNISPKFNNKYMRGSMKRVIRSSDSRWCSTKVDAKTKYVHKNIYVSSNLKVNATSNDVVGEWAWVYYACGDNARLPLRFQPPVYRCPGVAAPGTEPGYSHEDLKTAGNLLAHQVACVNTIPSNPLDKLTEEQLGEWEKMINKDAAQQVKNHQYRFWGNKLLPKKLQGHAILDNGAMKKGGDKKRNGVTRKGGDKKSSGTKSAHTMKSGSAMASHTMKSGDKKRNGVTKAMNAKKSGGTKVAGGQSWKSLYSVG